MYRAFLSKVVYTIPKGVGEIGFYIVPVCEWIPVYICHNYKTKIKYFNFMHFFIKS